MGPPGAMVLLLVAAAVTPGPNNLLMLRIGLEDGLRAVLAPATGVVLGGLAMLVATYAGVASLFAAHSWRRAVTVVCGAGAVAWLGVRLICSSFTREQVRSGISSARGVLGMFLFQFVNPKSWILVLTITAAARRDTQSVSLATLLVLFIVIPYVCLALWAGGGSLAANMLRDTKARARFDRATGALLALSALLLLRQP